MNEIKHCAERMGGEVTYWATGQEHATPEQERKIFDQLLKAAQANQFDGVVVTHVDRWARDNGRAKEGFEILRKADVRFFERTREYNLYNPTDRFQLGIMGESAEFFAAVTNEKSINSRIERAKRGIPSGNGNLPYARTFDRETETWGLDPEKLKLIRSAVKEYLNGEQRDVIARRMGLSPTGLYLIFKRHLGDKWQFRIRSKRFNMDETVPLTVPRLVDEETERKVLEKIQAAKTVEHGHYKNRYLLSRMVLCGHCGYAAYGQEVRGNRYYNHVKTKVPDQIMECGKTKFSRINAMLLEDAVCRDVFELFGDQPRIEKMIRDMTPDMDQLEQKKGELEAFRKKLRAIDTKRENIVEAIAEGAISKDDARGQMNKLRSQESSLKEKVERLAKEIDHTPTRKEISIKAQLIARWRKQYFKSEEHYDSLRWSEMRKLMESVFAGKCRDGSRPGVYVEQTKRGFRYTIKGSFPKLTGIIDKTRLTGG